MKKKILIIIQVILACFILMEVYKEITGNKILSVSRKIGTNISGSEIMESYETHGGFHNDGVTYYKIYLKNPIEVDDRWQTLPLDETMRDFICSDGTYYGNIPRCPYINNGYYLLIDRNLEEDETSSSETIFERGSYNFIIVVYSSAEGILYYYKFDT